MDLKNISSHAKVFVINWITVYTRASDKDFSTNNFFQFFSWNKKKYFLPMAYNKNPLSRLRRREDKVI
jgi:hypothetical protein